MTFYGTTATAAGIVVPKKYLTQVGDDGFRKQPIGAGPYKFVSHTPGVEVVLEANPDTGGVCPTSRTGRPPTPRRRRKGSSQNK
jgi:ABC-type transport system substrate-binding protein